MRAGGHHEQSRTVGRPRKCSFYDIPVHEEDELIQPFTAAPDVLNLFTEREEMVVQYEGDSDDCDGKYEVRR